MQTAKTHLLTKTNGILPALSMNMENLRSAFYRTKLYIVIFVFLIASPAFAGKTVDHYWVAYRTAFRSTSGNFQNPLFLMQIDALGNVTIPPKEVLPSVRNDSSSFLILTPRTQATLLVWSGYREVFQYVIDKNTRRVLSRNKTELKLEYPGLLGSTTREQNNFLLAKWPNSYDAGIAAVGLGPFGGFMRYWPLSPPGWLVRASGAAAVSGDGSSLVWTMSYRNILIFQKLNQQGMPSGKSNVISKYIGGVDLSNRLAGEKRHLVYRKVFEGRGCDEGYETVWIQTIDARTGFPQGEPILLQGRTESLCYLPLNSVFMDPKGKFLIYWRFSYCALGRCKTSVLLYQALDQNGKPKNPPKLIADNESVSFDVLLEEQP